MTILLHFPLNTNYFGAGSQGAMVTFRVDDLDESLKELEGAACASIRSERTTHMGDLRGYGIRRATAWSYGSRWQGESVLCGG
jgi:hypothetical protein